jgi:large subunit ribosomal protein L4
VVIQEKTKRNTEAASPLRALSLSDVGLDLSHRKQNDPVAFSVWIRSLLQNWRQGTVGCKDRSEVNRTNKKPWKQKGTGRARAGSARSPLWRGGGVIFGPQPRVHAVRIARAMKKNVLNAMLFDFFERNKVAALQWELQDDGAPKTSAAYAALKAADLHTKKVAFFLSNKDMLSYAAFANIPGVRILFFDQANAYDLAHSDHLLFLYKDIDQFKEMAARWI